MWEESHVKSGRRGFSATGIRQLISHRKKSKLDQSLTMYITVHSKWISDLNLTSETIPALESRTELLGIPGDLGIFPYDTKKGKRMINLMYKN